MINESTISFPEIFNKITSRGQVSEGTTSINQMLRLLLLTSRGELIGDPMFGSDLVKHVYDYNDAIMNDIIKKDIVMAVSEYMSNLIKVEYKDISIVNEGKKAIITIRYYINKADSISTYKLVMLKGERNDG